ncbi:MAG: hypothetical protein A3G76_15025 [Acidobacteria bacterium RIFCSPLOWO2_12_FULL_65_11]|nr:MAG: hypothetical protein A3G76_15025 [Acidobacteria bacterium RIFCSPLOWO2_12_FULL_65_11]
MSHGIPRAAAPSISIEHAERPGISSVVRGAIHAIDPALPLSAFRTLDDVVAESMAGRLFQMSLVLSFAVAAMLLAGLGIYGVMSYTVAQRTNEIGIRLALGAQPGSVRRMVLRDALRPVVVGLAFGVPLALVAASSLRSLLFGVVPQDAATVIGVCLALTATASFAAYVPARRASRVDPMVALRHE